jgi:hypothetical protein
MILHFRPPLIGQSWHRYVLSDQLQGLLTHANLFGAFDKLSVRYFGPSPRPS